MAAPIIALPIVVLLGMLVLGGIVLVVVLLANPKTRAAGGVLLGVGLLLLAGAACIMLLRVSRESTHYRRPATVTHRPARVSRPVRVLPKRVVVALPGEPNDVAPGEATPALPAPPLTDQPEPASDTPEKPEETEKPDAPTSPEDPKDVGTAEDALKSDTEPAPPDTPTSAPTSTRPSTRPEDEQRPSTPRPSWASAPPQQTAEGYRMSIAVGPFVNRQYCDEALPDELQRAVSDYVQRYRSEAAGRVRLETHYILRNVVRGDPWEEPVENPLGPKIKLDTDEDAAWMKLHVQLVFDSDVNKRIDQEFEAEVVRQRLGYAGTVLATVLGVLAVAFASLKIDQTTGGSCRGRLSAAAVAATLALLAVSAFVLYSVQQQPLAMSPPTPDVTLEAPIGHSTTPAESIADRVSVSRGRPSILMLILAPALLAGWVALLFGRKTRAPTLAVTVAALVAAGVHVLPGLDVQASIGPAELLTLAIAAVYLMLITALSRYRWSWVLGAIACMAAAMLFTPADPASMMLVAGPLCAAYTILVFARKAGQKDPAITKRPDRAAAEVAADVAADVEAG